VKFIFKILLVGITIFSSCSLMAQDKLLFLNGKEIKGKLIAKTNYEFTFKTNKNKQFVIDKYRIFSYTQNNKEKIVYEFDTLSGNFLKVKDMQYFVYGERDAQQTFGTKFVTLTGFAFGFTTGYLMYRDQSFLYIAAPLIFTVITLPFGTRVRQHKLTDTTYIKEDEYLRGYNRVAKGKRTQNALKSSLVGMGVGFLISLIINK